MVISYEKRLLQNRHAVPYNNCALVLKARSLQKGYFPPPVLDPKAVKNNSSPPHFSFSTSSEARCCLYGGVEGNYSRGGFSCWRCPGGQEGWLMLLCQPFPGGPSPWPQTWSCPCCIPLPSTRQYISRKLFGPEEASCSWRYKTQSSVDLNYALQLIAFPVWASGMKAASAAAAASSPAWTGTALRKGGKRKSPTGPTTPAASSPSLPCFLT